VYEATAVEAVELPGKAELPDVDFHSLYQINEDVSGWLYCPDTAINYPVVQGQDNDFYLSHLIDGSEGDCGTLFLDCDADRQAHNQVIYGHHMKDGSMFASLLHYQEQGYYDQHPVLYYITPRQSYEVRLFAGFTTQAVSAAYNQRFDRCDFGDWLTEMQNQSDFQSKTTPTTSDQVLTLSTCAYSFKDARYVVMGVLKPL
jgi:sortase B